MGLPIKEGPVRTHYGLRGFQAVAGSQTVGGCSRPVVLYCARHRFSTDAMEGTGNVMAVMDAMGHQSVNTMRIYATRTSGRFGKQLSAGISKLSMTVQ
jgi:integrase